MCPIVFKLGSFELFSYGLLLALSVVAGLITVNREASRYGWDHDQMTRLVVWTFLMGLLGGRIVYVLTRLSDPNFDFIATAFSLRSGFVYYGGLIASWLFLIWYVRRYKLPFWPVIDTFALAICIGQAVGRIGCLLGGCCYGTSTTLPWGVIMANEQHLGHLHPVQFYEFLVLVALFVPLWLRRRHKAYEGEISVWFLGVYAVARYLLEFLRGDGIRGYVIDGFMTTSQFISIPLFVIAVMMYFRLRPNTARSDGG